MHLGGATEAAEESNGSFGPQRTRTSDDRPYVGNGGSLRERSYFAGAVAGWLMLTG